MAEDDFTRDDVVRHLAELGYNNVDESKLDSFCADLKRLIKYEEKKRRVGEKLEQLEQSQRRLQESREETKDSSSTPEVARRKRRVRREDKKRAKEEKLKAKYAASGQDSTSSNIKEREDISSSAREVETSSEREEVDFRRTEYETSESSEVNYEDPSSLYIDVDLPHSRPSSSSLPLAASLLAQPAAGFIRVRSGPSVGRKGPASDPVALHQRYRDQWARVNIPGEKRHDKLRWAVRGWMMGEEPL